MHPQLLLLSENLRDHEFIAAVSAVTGFPFLVCKDPADALGHANRIGSVVLFVDVTRPELLAQFEEIFGAPLTARQGFLTPDCVHYISDHAPGPHGPFLGSSLFSHFVLRSKDMTRESGSHYGRVLRTLASVESNALSGEMVCELNHSSDKGLALEKVAEFLRAHDFMERCSSVIITAVDELLMNAIYDAPTDGAGEQALKTTLRNSPVQVSEGCAVRLHAKYDGEYGYFTVVDCCGSLDKEKVLSHLFALQTDAHYVPDASKAGAGIGLATTFLTGGSLLFVHEPQVRTEATVFFRRSNSFREFREQFRFVSIHRTQTVV